MNSTSLLIEYHSQPATSQDKWVIETYGQMIGGRFLEIGAHDGIRHSNTLTLERVFGWSGVLVEANPDVFSKLVVNRPKAKCFQYAVDQERWADRKFLVGRGSGDVYSGLAAHMSQEWLDNHRGHASNYNRMPTVSLLDVMNYGYGGGSFTPGSAIHYMSLDVEGAELPILRGMVKDIPPALMPRLMTVEFQYDQMRLENMESLLEPYYKLDQVRAFDACFIHRSML